MDPIENEEIGSEIGPKKTVFWRFAFIFVGVQVATGLIAVVLTGWLTLRSNLDLVSRNMELRLEAVAVEIERSIPAGGTLADTPVWMQTDLRNRFNDAIFLINPDGSLLARFDSDLPLAGGLLWVIVDIMPDENHPFPDSLSAKLKAGELLIRLKVDEMDDIWGLAPLYAKDGALLGGILVNPLTETFKVEVNDARNAYRDTFFLVLAMNIIIAIVFGGAFTWRIVKPIRMMTGRIEEIGGGNYASRIEVESQDEFGRLAFSINQMADAVQTSISVLQQTDRMRRELIANIGHDLRTPLAAMLGYSEEAERYMRAGDIPKTEESLRIAREQGQYLEKLITDLFELSQMDGANPRLRVESFPLAELLHDVNRRHQTQYREKGVNLTPEIPDDLPIIEGDAVRILRLMDNLLSNARKHTPAGGTVKLIASASQGWISIQVKDNGTGMSTDVLEHVFARYFHGTESRTRSKGGTGLGMAISRAIARAHGGDLTASSKLGEGSVFMFRIPVTSSPVSSIKLM